MIGTIDMAAEIDWAPTTEIEEVLQNVRMIVGVWRSEVPLDREMGIDPSLIDAPIGAARARLMTSLAETIKRCEPRARLQSLDFRSDPVEGIVQPIITVNVEE